MSGATTAPASQPSRAGGLLSLVRKLVSYGTFLAATLRQRGLGNHPAVHGRPFGTTNLTLILARIAGGLLRAAALERGCIAAPPASTLRPVRARRGFTLLQPRPSPAHRAGAPVPATPTMTRRCSRTCPRPKRSPPRSVAARSAR